MFSFMRLSSLIVAALSVSLAPAQDREWTYADSGYVFEAELVGFDDENVVLRRADNQLGMMKIEELSQADREFLKSKQAVENSNRNINKTQTWVTNSGLKLVGRVVDYVRGDMVVQRRRRRFYVNDRQFSNLPELYQKLLPKIVEPVYSLLTNNFSLNNVDPVPKNKFSNSARSGFSREHTRVSVHYLRG